LSAPFSSRSFRWNFLPARARPFAVRNRPIPAVSCCECIRPEPDVEKHSVEKPGVETRFCQKRTRKKETRRVNHKEKV
jgi:hypothetical protein